MVDWFAVLYGTMSAALAVGTVAALLWAARQDGETNRRANANLP
jgi:hypothetical protein